MKRVVDKIDADELINNLRFKYDNSFVMYLKELWNVSFIFIKNLFNNILKIRTYLLEMKI